MLLGPFRKRIEREVPLAVQTWGEETRLREACLYALTNGGKRLRPLIVLLIAEALGQGFDVMPAALSVEYFHTASLIADDLPCMDDDDLRRGCPSVHRVFGEGTAILASFTLIAAGYGGIALNRQERKGGDRVALYCLEAASRAGGLKGATSGQFLDLHPPDLSLDTMRQIIYQKTSVLFEIAFLFGWLFGGGGLDAVEELKSAAAHLGMAFQIADDLDDDGQDANQEKEMNIVTICGKEKALSLFEEELASFHRTFGRLGLWTPAVQELFSGLGRVS